MKYYAVAPSGLILLWLCADTEEGVWEALIENGKKLPYPPSKEAFIERGYRIISQDELDICVAKGGFQQ